MDDFVLKFRREKKYVRGAPPKSPVFVGGSAPYTKVGRKRLFFLNKIVDHIENMWIH